MGQRDPPAIGILWVRFRIPAPATLTTASMGTTSIRTADPNSSAAACPRRSSLSTGLVPPRRVERATRGSVCCFRTRTLQRSRRASPGRLDAEMEAATPQRLRRRPEACRKATLAARLDGGRLVADSASRYRGLPAPTGEHGWTRTRGRARARRALNRGGGAWGSRGLAERPMTILTTA